MKYPKKLAAVAALGIATALVLSGCGGASSPNSNGNGASGAHGTELIVSQPQEPTSWNYLEDTSTALMVPIYLNVVESLFESSEDGTLNPLLAESYDVSDDMLDYTIHLREAKFHDGTDFDSADVVYSLEKNKTATNGNISGPLAVVETITAVDPQTVAIHLSRPSKNFTQGLGNVATMMAPEGAFESADISKHLVGTGPFVFGEYRPDVDLVLEQFADYWGEKPFMTKVTNRFIKDETAAINALRANEINVIGMLLGEGVDQVPTLEDSYNVTFNPATQVSYLYLNPSAEQFKDERVRQAIAYAIDRQPIIDASVGGYAEPMCLYVFPMGVPWNTDYCPYTYDPDKSRELLKEAGFDGSLELYFPYLSIAEFPPAFEVINAQLADVGITTEAKGMDFATWAEQAWTGGAYDISHITGNLSLDALSCHAGATPFGIKGKEYCDEEFEKYLASNDQILDEGEYVAAMTETVNHLTDTAWIIPLFGKTEPTVADRALTGLASYRTAVEMDFRSIKWTD